MSGITKDSKYRDAIAESADCEKLRYQVFCADRMLVMLKPAGATRF